MNKDEIGINELICDCYRFIHPPFRKVKIKGKWVQRPYHYDIEDYQNEVGNK